MFLPRWIAAAALAAVVSASSGAWAGPGEQRLGCILREPGVPARFVASRALTREDIAQEVRADRALRRSPLIDGCRLGLRREIDAASYARLASRRPDRFAPLAASDLERWNPERAAGAAAKNWMFADLTAATSSDTSFFAPAVPLGREGVLGTLFAFDGAQQVAVFRDGRFVVYGEGFAGAVNAAGLVGGGVLVDPDAFIVQAALFRPGQRWLIPMLPNAVFSVVLAVADDGLALVQHDLAEPPETVLTTWDGRQHRAVDFGPDVPYAFFVAMNGNGQISGTTQRDGHFIGFRHDIRSGQTLLLAPLPAEPEAFALGINRRGDVVGYSFVWSDIERIGTWDARGVFTVRIVQGIPDRPTLSNWLAINDAGLIAISSVSYPPQERGRAYAVPPAGGRIDLSAAVAGWPPALAVGRIYALDDLWQMLGWGTDPDSASFFVDFLLQRRGP